MRVLRHGSAVALALGAWLGLGAGFAGGPHLSPPGAAAQGTLISPGGQPRVTAPGGLSGRGMRRHRRMRVRRARHHGGR